MKPLILAFILSLTGCAGTTMYKITTPEGLIIEAQNSKDYETYKLIAKKGSDGSYEVTLEETGVSASDPLKAAQEVNSALIDKIIGLIVLP